MIYAYDRCMEVAIAACATPVVGLVAEHWYGYVGAVARQQVGIAAGSHAAAVCCLTPVPRLTCTPRA